MKPYSKYMEGAECLQNRVRRTNVAPEERPYHFRQQPRYLGCSDDRGYFHRYEGDMTLLEETLASLAAAMIGWATCEEEDGDHPSPGCGRVLLIACVGAQHLKRRL